MELRRGERAIVRIGHRGAPLEAPENTIESFAAAIELGADAVEVDVSRGRDGVLVLSHEHGRGVSVGAVSLDEALAFLAAREVLVQLDLKDGGLEEAVVAAVRRHGLLGCAYVSTPRASSLRTLHAAEPALGRALTYPDDRLKLSNHPVARPFISPALAQLRRILPRRLPRFLRAAHADAATLDLRVVTPAVVRACHSVDAAVYVWTVDDAGLARTLVEAGADGIITNDLRIFQGLLTT